MPRWLVIDEVHVFLSVPQFDTGAVRAMRRTLPNRRFLTRLKAAVQKGSADTPALGRVRIRVHGSRSASGQSARRGPGGATRISTPRRSIGATI